MEDRRDEKGADATARGTVLEHRSDSPWDPCVAWAVTALSSSRGERWLARSSFVGHEARVFVMDGRHDVHILERPCQRSREGGKKNKRLYLQVYTMGSEHEAEGGGKSERGCRRACELVTR